MLKAGGHWTAQLVVPEDIRETGAKFASGGNRRVSQEQQEGGKERQSVTWIIEIASQVLFSNSAVVHFELLVGRDERSLDLGFAAVAGHGHGAPGQVKDYRQDKQRTGAHPKGIYSRAVKLVVEDTEALWNKPSLPTPEGALGDGEGGGQGRNSTDAARGASKKSLETQRSLQTEGAGRRGKKKKIHLVILTHGLHSNIGADMLYLKESIDATAKQAREDARRRKAAYKAKGNGQPNPASSDSSSEQSQDESKETGPAPVAGGQEELRGDEEDEDEEEVIVRGFTGNAVRTEKGIQYLGKRLAKFVLHTTYPDQPFLPVKKSMTRSFTDTFVSPAKKEERDGPQSHGGSSIHKDDRDTEELAYTFTSISFIGHSLGGLIQTYAIAYIQKHAPHFFEKIKPVNFVCLASPLLGLSNENPMYVKFALDFGLVGRTGQDLGLTWRPPTIAKNGWSAMMGGFGGGQKEDKQQDPGAKPLLRILPTGPAHHVLRLFRNRTVYSNVVNDGIVPLRTSCLLFLDWRGLGKVEKARRENGLIGTMAEWGWAELTGANSYNPSPQPTASVSREDSPDGTNTPTRNGAGDTVPQPPEGATDEDNRHSTTADPKESERRHSAASQRRKSVGEQNTGVLDTVFNFFRPGGKGQPSKVTKAVRRGQTMSKDDEQEMDPTRGGTSRGTTDNPMMRQGGRPPATRGDSLEKDPHNVLAPPRTSILESASDILHPPIPSVSWITDPSSRSRTIFHDRVYHPEDIPPPPIRRPTRLARSFSSESALTARSINSEVSVDSGAMKVEEKIARAYHKDLSWRKVLVRLEPDAHNNMIVRRMFANAYGWPVVKHLCDTHFADTWVATTRDEEEPGRDRAQGRPNKVTDTGEEVEGQHDASVPDKRPSEMREAADELTDLAKSTQGSNSLSSRHKLDRQASSVWDDSYFEGTDEDDEDEEGFGGMVQRLFNPGRGGGRANGQHGGRQSTPRAVHSSDLEGHRGLQPTNSSSSTIKPPSKARVAEEQEPGDADPEFTGQLTEEPQSLDARSAESPGSAIEVGLRKSIEEQISPPRRKGTR